MPAADPFISVLLPVYQGAAYLERALAGIYQQADAATTVEVIAVDDGSTDDSVAILKRWRDRLDLRIMEGGHGGNWVKNTNVAMAAARGTWLSWLHQDDGWRPGRLATLRGLAGANPEAGFLLHPAQFVDPHDRLVGRWGCPLPPGRLLDSRYVLPRLVVQNFIPIVSPLVRREVAESVGLMDETLWYFADWDYWLRAAARTPVYYHNEPLAFFRIHPESQTALRTRAIGEVGRQFDVVTDRVLADPAFPGGDRERSVALVAFARAAYLFMLAGLHGGSGEAGRLVRTAFRVGPAGWWRYWVYSRLFDRLTPRLRMMRWRAKQRIGT